MIQKDSDIYDYILREEINYKRPIPLTDSWNWNMYEHIRLTFLYTNSQLSTGKSDFKPVKNITLPILNLAHRTEDIELKDVQIYVDDPDKYHLSFLVKKYHDDVFVQENDLDTFFDELNVSRIDYGAGLSKKLTKPAPEVVPLQSIAFCDQTDILSGPIGIKHYYSPDQLLDMEKVGWGSEANGATISIPDLIMLSREDKKETATDKQTATTPGRYIEVYEVHGNLPKKFADSSDTSGKYETRLFICAFYQKKDRTEKQGVILYTALEKESPFKLIKRDPIYGRALGRGGAEELFEPQVWVNYDMIRLQDMLDSASKTILKASGPSGATLANRNKVKDMDNLQIIDVADGDLAQVDTFPRNFAIFEKSVTQWEAHAQQLGAANDSIMGQPPTAGTPFKLQELVTQESHGLHDYRRGQYAKHVEEVYKDWIIPHIQKKITEGSKFLSELSLEELNWVAEQMATCEVNKQIWATIEKNVIVTPEDQQVMIDAFKEDFKKKGNKHFIDILKGEFKATPLGVKVSVAGKSKNLGQTVDKITNMVRFVLSTYNPQTNSFPALDDPRVGQLVNEALELSDMKQIDMSPRPQKMAQPSPQLATQNA